MARKKQSYIKGTFTHLTTFFSQGSVIALTATSALLLIARTGRTTKGHSASAGPMLVVVLNC